jgi:arylsulfatase A-like enzyme
VKAQEQNKPVNILFIAVDDLRTDLGIYGNAKIHSPNIDALGRDGVVYQNHYVSVPTCGASRYSFLTGMRPRSVGDLSNAVAEHKLSKKPETGKPETFIHHFKRNGYRTVGIGKISHSADGYNYGYLEEKSDELELPHSWDEMLFNPGKWGNGWNAFFGYADGSDRNHLDNQTSPLEHADVEDTGYPDGLTAELAVQKLGELAKGNQPFFLGVGFFKPYLPFNAPQKYWDLYDKTDIDLAPFRGIPEYINLSSMNNNGEFNQYLLGKEKARLDDPISDEYARELPHAYFSAVSYVDAQVGKVVDELKRLGLYENTVIILWGDHGWHLGGQNM